MNEATITSADRTTNRRASRRTLGLLAAAATTTVGLAVMTTSSAANEAPPTAPKSAMTADAEASLVDRGIDTVRNLFSDDDIDTWENCPACGMG